MTTYSINELRAAQRFTAPALTEKEFAMIQVYSNRTLALNGRIVGRIDRDSYAMPSGEVRGQTVFYTGRPGAFDQPHRIGAPLYVPAVAGSASDWRINPDFEAEVRAALAGATAS